MKRLLTILLMLAATVMHASSPDGIVPRPLETELLKGGMRVAGAPFKCDPDIDSVSFRTISRFAAELSLASGRTCAVSAPVGIEASVGNGSAKGMIFLRDKSMLPEEYRIEIGHRYAVVSASGTEGFAHALQTLRQLLPESIYAGVPAENERWILPCCTIHDRPGYEWRGLMLDCSRHFWSVGEIKRCLDLMERYKLNRFHWHLTDDQGWRIEIKSLPLLTQIACWREGTATEDSPSDHIRYGGFYTQDEVREIVRYARERGITVVPEITLPGHVLAALSAYPEVGCTGGPYAAATDWEVSDQLICAGKETGFEFLEKVLSETAALFPSEYIHIGGSDCPTTEWEKCPDCRRRIEELGLQDNAGLLGYFLTRVGDMLAREGKKAVLRSEEPSAEGLTMMEAEGRTEVLEDGEVIGIQTDIWTEHISAPEQLEARLLSALPQLSEIQW